MAARPLQPSEYDIQREVEALRDIKRRSTAPGALTIDPDLPNQSPPSSPTSQYRSGKSPILASVAMDANLNLEASSSIDFGHSTSTTPPLEAPNNPSDDPFHLFWVPASLHPEIAPAEFRAFLKEHSRSPPLEGQDPSERAGSPSSLSASPSLGRKTSMLRRQYKPKENDDVEDENIFPIKRNRSLLRPTNQGPQLTINDLQKLEELAEEAHESDDPSRLRSVLRRSLSLNLSPSAIDMMDEMPDMGDEADVPIIVPPPGQILRRAARTKIRKAGLPGDGGGHRFGASRRGGGKSSTTTKAEQRTSSDISSSDHGDAEPQTVVLRRPTFSDDAGRDISRPDSFSEESSIYDAYARSEEDEIASGPAPATPPEPPAPTIVTDGPPATAPAIPPIPADTLRPAIHQPQPQRLLVPQPPQGQTVSRTPSPTESTYERSPIPPPFLSTSPSSPQIRKEKDKDRKGLFGKWGTDKGGKKGNKDRENRERASTAEKDKEQSGFFGSLFGKKKQDSEYQPSMAGGTAGREAAQALLGASKSSKSALQPPSPGLAPGIGGNPYARYPIHVERAIYRLSHIKLANPRRPLYEQVLISNLMFWYLGVINKAQNPTAAPANSVPTNGPQVAENESEEEKEKEQEAKEQKEKAEKERLERERLEKEQRERERELELKKKDSGRRATLTKVNSAPPGGGRRAEMPIKGPQYEMQHRVMEQEYGYNGQPRSPTAPSIPVTNGAPPMQQYGRPPQQQHGNGPPKVAQPQPKPQSEHYYYQPPPPENHSPRPVLPPGAMAPLDRSNWMAQPPPSTFQPQQGYPLPNPAPQRRSRSPPPQSPQQFPSMQLSSSAPLRRLNTSPSQENLVERNGGYRGAGRSLSATATSPAASPPVNGHIRKGNGGHASAPLEKRPRTTDGAPFGISAVAGGDEEDVPLAVWQQGRK